MFKSVTQWLDYTAKRLPSKIAFGTETKDGVSAMTFSELCSAARKIGANLAAAGYFKEPVLIAMDKTPQCVAAMLGCAYANCPYAPVDVDNPFERMEKIIRKLQPCAYITVEKYKSKFGDVSKVLIYDELISDERITKTASDMLLDAVHERRISTDILYIIFTSGSTGMPKGVAVSHVSVIDYSLELSEKFGFGEKTVFGQSVPFFFDSSILYLYQTIKNGCTDWIISRISLMFPAKTIDFLCKYRCNTIYWVPTSYSIIAKSGVLEKRIPENLSQCFFVGEVMPGSVLNVWRRHFPNAKFVNLFGPTEITDTFIYYVVDREFKDDEPIPIGKRYDNCDVFLLNDDNTPTEDGCIGELCVRGIKVSNGYWNEPEKTAKVFIQNPLNSHYREFIYKTGDLARVNGRGEFIYAGRKDLQVKHAGHRIELGEIEAAVNSVESVEMCACVFDRERNTLVLFYVGSADKSTIRGVLKDKLQDYMIPDRLEKIEKMPRTGSGKISRTELLELLS